jgi:hypothetical protein
MKISKLSAVFSNPWLSLLAAIVFSLITILLEFVITAEKNISFLLYYFLPVFIVFYLFLFERLSNRKITPWISGVVDGGVLTLSILRAFYTIPYFSGHALFLSYVLLSTKRFTTRVVALMVLLEVVILKVFIWHDATLYGGLLLGFLAGGVWLCCEKVTSRAA